MNEGNYSLRQPVPTDGVVCMSMSYPSCITHRYPSTCLPKDCLSVYLHLSVLFASGPYYTYMTLTVPT